MYCAAVILLSFVLAIGFLLIILSCALWSNWLPLLVGTSSATHAVSRLADPYVPAFLFVIAPLPNAVFARLGQDDLSGDYEGSPAVDLGRFITSVVVVTGFALPIVLAHSEIITPTASIMSIAGGGLVYGTIMAYTRVFRQEQDEF